MTTETINIQKKLCAIIEAAFLFGKLSMSEEEHSAVKKMRQYDRPLATWHISVLTKLVNRMER